MTSSMSVSLVFVYCDNSRPAREKRGQVSKASRETKEFCCPLQGREAAQTAIDVFVYRIHEYIEAYVAVLVGRAVTT